MCFTVLHVLSVFAVGGEIKSDDYIYIRQRYCRSQGVGAMGVNWLIMAVDDQSSSWRRLGREQNRQSAKRPLPDEMDGVQGDTWKTVWKTNGEGGERRL